MLHTCLITILFIQLAIGAPLPQQYVSQSQPTTNSHYPAQQQEVNQNKPTLSAHHGFMYAPQTSPSLSQTHQFSSHPTQQTAQTAPTSPSNVNTVSIDDPDVQLLARSLKTGIASVGYTQPLTPQELPPCNSDGRSVTIDHLRISPDSLVQIARLAQAFGSNPDWKKLRFADMKTTLDSPMNPTHQFAARSIGL